MSVGIPPPNSQILPPSPTTCPSRRRPFLPAPGIALPKLPALSHHVVLLGSGLRTPPADDMSTTYQPAPTAYEYASHSYPSSMTHTSRSKATATVGGTTASVGHDARTGTQYYIYSSQQPQHAPVPSSQPKNSSFSTSQTLLSSSSSHTKPSTPTSATISVSSKRAASTRKSSETLIYHSLQIPKCISANGGNLADFAAQVSFDKPQSSVSTTL